jgi:hypothetical protein
VARGDGTVRGNTRHHRRDQVRYGDAGVREGLRQARHRRARGEAAARSRAELLGDRTGRPFVLGSRTMTASVSIPAVRGRRWPAIAEESRAFVSRR